MMKRLIYILSAVLMLSVSCSPKVIEHVRTEYVYRDRTQHDTTYVHDSTYIKEYIKGDTVRIVKFREKYKYLYKYINKIDTVAVHDTLSVEKIKKVKVERALSWWQKTKIRGFWALLFAWVIYLVWANRKRLLPIIRRLILHV